MKQRTTVRWAALLSVLALASCVGSSDSPEQGSAEVRYCPEPTYPDFRGDPRKVPSIDGVVFERVAIHGAEHAGRIVGLPDSPITGVVLREVSIHAGDDLRVVHAAPPAEASVTRDLNPADVRPRPKYRE